MSNDMLENSAVDTAAGSESGISDPEESPHAGADHGGKRLLFALCASLLVNLVTWTLVAESIHTPMSPPLPPATFKLIQLTAPPKPHKLPRILTKPIKPHPPVEHKTVVQHPRPAPVLHHVIPPVPISHPSHVLVSRSPGSKSFDDPPPGKAAPGQPVQTPQEPPKAPQQPVVNPLTPGPETPTPPAQPAKPAPPVIPPKPAPPAGPTEDATPSNQVYPDIPDDLKSDDYKSFVRVKVDILATGTFSVTLVSSSGNTDIDQRVLDALKHWKWKPAFSDGTPIDSTQRFRFNFEVN